jgi:hypothetical protein
MTGEQITKKQMTYLLGVAAQFDGRPLEPETFEAWHQLLGDLPYADVADAFRTHYRRPAVPGEKRWTGITPQDVMAHVMQLEAARQLEQARQSPPACWGGGGCEVRYVLSGREGSRWALPDGEHAAGCKAYKGVLKFNRERGTWGVMTIDPADFDEAAFEAPVTHELWRAEPSVDWVSRLAVGAGDGEGDAGE